MGILDSIERKRIGKEIPKEINPAYESMDEETRNRIVTFFRRLFMRGTPVEEAEYCSDSNICVRDRASDMICFRQGVKEGLFYFGLIIQEEMWRVTCRSTINAEGKQTYFNVRVRYIPSKIGKVSRVDKEVEKIAALVLQMYSDENYTEYIDELKLVFAADSIDEYTVMKNSWYNQIFEDENCRKLREYQNSQVEEVKEEKVDTVFDYALVDESKEESLVEMINQNVRSDIFVFRPKICAVNLEKNVSCFKMLKNNPEEYGNVQYYVMLIDSDLVLLGVSEEKTTGTINIEKVIVFGEEISSQDTITNMGIDAISKLEELNYLKPQVACPDHVHVECESHYKQIEI